MYILLHTRYGKFGLRDQSFINFHSSTLNAFNKLSIFEPGIPIGNDALSSLNPPSFNIPVEAKPIFAPLLQVVLLELTLDGVCWEDCQELLDIFLFCLIAITYR